MNANVQSVQGQNKLNIKKWSMTTSHEESIQEENHGNNSLVDLFNDRSLNKSVWRW